MARFRVQLWTRRDLPFAGKLILEPQTAEEKAALDLFKAHVGAEGNSSGNKLVVLYRWRDRANGKLEEGTDHGDSRNVVGKSDARST